MANKLFIEKIGQEYYLSKSFEDTKDVTRYEPILERGTLPELLYSLSTISKEFYQEGVKVNYGHEPRIIKIPTCEKEAINNFVRTLEKIAFRKSLESISI